MVKLFLSLDLGTGPQRLSTLLLFFLGCEQKGTTIIDIVINLRMT